MRFIKEIYENIHISEMRIRWEEIKKKIEFMPWLSYNQSLSELVGGERRKVIMPQRTRMCTCCLEKILDRMQKALNMKEKINILDYTEK